MAGIITHLTVQNQWSHLWYCLQ